MWEEILSAAKATICGELITEISKADLRDTRANCSLNTTQASKGFSTDLIDGKSAVTLLLV
jgi:hypothetical protein